MHKALDNFYAWLDGEATSLPSFKPEHIEALHGEELLAFLRKLLLHPRRAEGVRLLVESGLASVVLPELNELVGVEQPEKFHPEGDCFEHTVLALAKLDEPAFELALATLLHDIGKPRTYSLTDRIRFNAHESVSARMTRDICRRMDFDPEKSEYVEKLVALHMQVKDVERMNEKSIAKFVRAENFHDLIRLARADCLASHGDLSIVDYALKRADEIGPEPLPPPPPLLTGADLIEEGYSPGPAFGVMLKSVATLRKDGKITSRDEALDFIRNEFPGQD